MPYGQPINIFLANSKKKKLQWPDLAELRSELKFLEDKEARMAELRKRRTSLNRAVVVNQDADFDELFKDLEEVREAVARELKEINGGGGRGGGPSLTEEEEERILSDYDSEGEDGASSKWRSKLDDFGDPAEEEVDHSVRVYYCSRTHSQLSQFVKEVQKTEFSQSGVRLVSLASRYDRTC